MLNSKINIKFYNKLNIYYNDIFLCQKNISEKIYKIAYPIFYKEVYYFWLYGTTLKIVKHSQSLNKIVKFKSSLHKVKFTLYFYFETPYLII